MLNIIFYLNAEKKLIGSMWMSKWNVESQKSISTGHQRLWSKVLRRGERKGEREHLHRVLSSNRPHRWREIEGWRGKRVLWNICGHRQKAPEVPEDIERRKGKGKKVNWAEDIPYVMESLYPEDVKMLIGQRWREDEREVGKGFNVWP